MLDLKITRESSYNTVGNGKAGKQDDDNSATGDFKWKVDLKCIWKIIVQKNI